MCILGVVWLIDWLQAKGSEIQAQICCAVQVSVLAWEGMGGRAAKWQSHRWLHVWRGRLYLTPHKEDPEICLSRTYWLNYRVVQVPPEVSVMLLSDVGRRFIN